MFTSLNEYWRDFPPVNELFAAFVGLKPQNDGAGRHDPGEWSKFKAQFAGLAGAAPASQKWPIQQK